MNKALLNCVTTICLIIFSASISAKCPPLKGKWTSFSELYHFALAFQFGYTSCRFTIDGNGDLEPDSSCNIYSTEGAKVNPEPIPLTGNYSVSEVDGVCAISGEVTSGPTTLTVIPGEGELNRAGDHFHGIQTVTSTVIGDGASTFSYIRAD
jgi:hypothetical protein